MDWINGWHRSRRRLGLLHALASITFRADQIVSGVSINLLAIGITEFLGRSATSRRVEGLTHWDLPLIGSYSFVVYLTPILVIISQIVLFRTVLGLRLSQQANPPKRWMPLD